MRQPGTLTRIGSASPSNPKVAEFFAGVGLVRLGLQAAGFDVVWSNDIHRDKQQMYEGHHQDPADRHTFVLGDIAEVRGDSLPTDLAMAWASFPCTDLSLAGGRRGLLAGTGSSTFWQFTRVLEELGDERPQVVALENVVGLATSRAGEDLASAIAALNTLGYSMDVVTLDARRFVPQSRPRLFMIGALKPPGNEPVPHSELRPDWLQGPFEDPTLTMHQAALPPPPPPLTEGLTMMTEEIAATDSQWWDQERAERFLRSLSPLQAGRLEALRTSHRVSCRTAYRRTRHGRPVWEIRPDDVSGCLRTARGGSSKQAIVRAGRGEVSVRWMTPREYSRLMGAGDFRLVDIRRNQALFGFGDAVCVPVVSWLAEHYLMPLVRGDFEAVERGRLTASGA